MHRKEAVNAGSQDTDDGYKRASRKHQARQMRAWNWNIARKDKVSQETESSLRSLADHVVGISEQFLSVGSRA